MQTITSIELSTYTGIAHKKILTIIAKHRNLFDGATFVVKQERRVGRPKKIYQLDARAVAIIALLTENRIYKKIIFEALENCEIIDEIRAHYE